MKLKGSALVIFLLSGIMLIRADDDDDDSHQHDDDDDDDGIPHYCPKDNGMFPNPTDCTTYFNCVDGQAIAMACAPGLLFDKDTHMCNFPGQVKCKNECQGPNGLFPSQHRCDEFVLCTNNKPKVMRCKKGLYFDANLQVCNYKGQVLCNLTGKKRKKGNKEEYVPTKQCPKPTGIFQNISNCSTFYLCNEGVHHLQECPGGLHFNSRRVNCDFPKVANCEGKDGTPKVTPKPQPKKKFKKSQYCPKLDGIFENESNCSSFYFCVDGIAYLQECPPGLVFDIKNVKCDLPKVVGCKPPPGIISVLRCPFANGIFRHPTECGTFFLCRGNRSYKHECPKGLIFDYKEKRCGYSRDIKCPEDYLERRKHANFYMKVKQINVHDYVT